MVKEVMSPALRTGNRIRRPIRLRAAACRRSRQGRGSRRRERAAGHLQRRRGRRRGDEREGEARTGLDGRLEVAGMTAPVLPLDIRNSSRPPIVGICQDPESVHFAFG